MMGHNGRQFINELESGYYERESMSNEYTRQVALDAYNLEASRELPTSDDVIAYRKKYGIDPLPVYERKADNGDRNRRTDKVSDPVNQPAHYRGHKSGIECIQITEHMGFNIGNAVKYLWRCDLKNDAIEDLKKAAWYIAREIAKREKAAA